MYLAHGPSARTIRRRLAEATRRSIAAAAADAAAAAAAATAATATSGSTTCSVADSDSDATADDNPPSGTGPLHNAPDRVAPAAAMKYEYDTDSDGPLDSSDDDDDDSVTEDGRMLGLLRRLTQWKLMHNVTNAAFNDLLKVLRYEHPALPKDSRTVVCPPKDVQYRRFDGGTYHHFGLISSVTHALQRDKEHIHDGFCVELQLGIDGLPVHKSTKWHLWPILGRVENTPSRLVFAIGVFFGETKPLSCENFLNEFKEEYTAIGEGGFQLFGCTVTLKITTVICDAPARAFVKCVRQYNHSFGCDKCCEEGEYDGRMMFLGQNAAKRTDESFRQRQQSAHHRRHDDEARSFMYSPLEKAGLGVCRRDT